MRIGCCNRWYVALLAEGVDRNNFNFAGVRPNPAVALLAEGVDRNLFTDLSRDASDCWSPSSRRAWIEIRLFHDYFRSCYVALLAEGVDRNRIGLLQCVDVLLSPSSRRAWIEISQ